jgi:hypothetical protein
VVAGLVQLGLGRLAVALLVLPVLASLGLSMAFAAKQPLPCVPLFGQNWFSLSLTTFLFIGSLVFSGTSSLSDWNLTLAVEASQ